MTKREQLNAECIGAMVRISEDILRMKEDVRRINERIQMSELEMSRIGALVVNSKAEI